MRKLAFGLVALVTMTATLVTVPRLMAQPPPGGRDARPDDARDARPPRGGFIPPAPPVLTVLDRDGDGEISAAELKDASRRLKTLDKDRDGQLADGELIPEFGGGFPGRGGFGGGPGGFNPLGGQRSGKLLAPNEVEFKDGVAKIPDHATYHKLSYRGEAVMIDTFLTDLEFVKFTIDKATSDKPQLYFINTKTHRAHMMFASAVGLPRGGREQMKGVLVYRPLLKSPSGSPGLYTFEFEPFDQYSFEMVKLAHDILVEKFPPLKGNLGYYPRERGIAKYQQEQEAYAKSDLPVYLEEDLNKSDIGFLPLNPGASFGRLRLMEHDERPTPRDVVIYKSLPNELPRVAGIITGARQTPLSHVNLRAIQDQVPNAFITAAWKDEQIKPLIGKLVAYQVTADGYAIRAASADEVQAHFAAMRPAKTQTPARNLTNKKIRPLDEVSFQDSESVGVKAANVAVMRTFGFEAGTVPNGYAVPFYYYDEFMKHNGFYAAVSELLANPEFRDSRDVQIAKLKELRSLIKKGKMPSWMMDELETIHQAFPAGTSLRLRSSTNNEDLAGFSGAGLYNSYTHRQDEGHLSQSIKQVFASLWNFRAFEERDFYRVDHLATAMGVLVHPNYEDESVNGVAVTDDVLYQTAGNYYVNSQVGEDLVTNPGAESVPEEILIDWWKSSDTRVMRASNRVLDGKRVLEQEHVDQLRKYLSKIHSKFSRLYGHSLNDERFAMEIEFKITKSGQLVIKQARPWIYADRPAQLTTK